MRKRVTDEVLEPLTSYLKPFLDVKVPFTSLFHFPSERRRDRSSCMVNGMLLMLSNNMATPAKFWNCCRKSWNFLAFLIESRECIIRNSSVSLSPCNVFCVVSVYTSLEVRNYNLSSWFWLVSCVFLCTTILEKTSQTNATNSCISLLLCLIFACKLNPTGAWQMRCRTSEMSDLQYSWECSNKCSERRGKPWSLRYFCPWIVDTILIIIIVTYYANMINSFV